jgi:hypothetical protein
LLVFLCFLVFPQWWCGVSQLCVWQLQLWAFKWNLFGDCYRKGTGTVTNTAMDIETDVPMTLCPWNLYPNWIYGPVVLSWGDIMNGSQVVSGPGCMEDGPTPSSRWSATYLGQCRPHGNKHWLATQWHPMRTWWDVFLCWWYKGHREFNNSNLW